MEDFLNMPEPKVRPTLLTVLCILTFVGSSYSILQGIFTYRSATFLSEMASDALHRNKSMQDSAYAHFPADTAQIADTITIQHREQKKSEFQQKMQQTMGSFLDKGKLQKNALYSILAAIMTLGGAILMWRLSRKGFYLYIAGVIVSILAPILIFGNNLFVLGMAGFSGFFGILFIVLYALNIKNMKP